MSSHSYVDNTCPKQTSTSLRRRGLRHRLNRVASLTWTGHCCHKRWLNWKILTAEAEVKTTTHADALLKHKHCLKNYEWCVWNSEICALVPLQRLQQLFVRSGFRVNCKSLNVLQSHRNVDGRSILVGDDLCSEVYFIEDSNRVGLYYKIFDRERELHLRRIVA